MPEALVELIARIGSLITKALLEADSPAGSVVSRSMREVGVVCIRGELRACVRPMILEVVR